MLAKEFEALGVDLVVLEQAIDTTTLSVRLMFHVLGAVAEFERSLIVERVKAGMRRAKTQGIRLGRPRVYDLDPDEVAALKAEGLSLGEIGRRLGNGHSVHPTIVRRALARAIGPLADTHGAPLPC
jgi:DNA invertase Pin-like site-specific DNA recombinase